MFKSTLSSQTTQLNLFTLVSYVRYISIWVKFYNYVLLYLLQVYFSQWGAAHDRHEILAAVCPELVQASAHHFAGRWEEEHPRPLFSYWCWFCKFSLSPLVPISNRCQEHLELVLNPGSWQMVTQEWSILDNIDNYEGSYLALHAQITFDSAETISSHFTLNTTIPKF